MKRVLSIIGIVLLGILSIPVVLVIGVAFCAVGFPLLIILLFYNMGEDALEDLNDLKKRILKWKHR